MRKILENVSDQHEDEKIDTQMQSNSRKHNKQSETFLYAVGTQIIALRERMAVTHRDDSSN